MTELRYLNNVVTLTLDVDKCVGCGLCAEVCPHAVFTVAGGKAEIVDRDACMECGACAGNCPVEAISVVSGVGCATGVIIGALRGTEPTCGCGDEEDGGPKAKCC